MRSNHWNSWLRLRGLLLALALLLAPLLGLAATPAQAASGDCTTANGQTTCTFDYTGAPETWTVPAGVTRATFDLYGAHGGRGSAGFNDPDLSGGNGGHARATLTVAPGTVYQILVGGSGGDGSGGDGQNSYNAGSGGYNGGGSGGAGYFDGGAGGGGASDVRIDAFELADRLLVAGGGGGSGNANGGAGGYPNGGAGGFDNVGGGGGSQTAGGAGVSGGSDGSLGQGGQGSYASGGAGGGGGGYYGGGGGGHYGDAGGAGGGGGGGSSYGPAGAAFETGVRTGNGQVIISYSYDTTAPTASPNQSPAANANGWNNGDVTVSWNWSDSDSGIDSAHCTASTSSGEGQQTLSASCADQAGNQGSASYAVKVDKTAPTISATMSSAPNANGWYKGDVSVAFSCQDALSGVASCSASQTLSAEGAAISSAAQSVSDRAGNTSAPSNVVTVAIDKTAPAVSVTGVTNGASYPLGSVPAADCTTTDALSGVASAATLSITGGNPDGMGSFTASCSGATDKAGNTGSASVSYTVAYRWSGFFQPVDNLPTVNSVKAGSAIPIKFSLGGNYGLNIFAAGYPKVQTVACGSSAPTDEIEQTLTVSSSSLSYDAATGQYSYTWKTDKSWAGSCRQLTLRLVDGTDHVALFQFK